MVSVRPVLVLSTLLASGLAALPTPLSAQVSLGIDRAPTQASPLEHRLASRASLVFGELTLEDLAKLLQRQFSFNVRLDLRALDDVGLGPKTPVPAADLSNVVLEDALASVLKGLDLTMLVRGEILVITTPEQAESELQTRIYPVADLVNPGRPSRAIGGPRADDDDPLDDYDTLIRTITSTLAPDSWDEVGGAGSIEAFPVSRALVISQTYEVHRWIAPLLESLRQAKTVSRKLVGEEPVHRGVVGSQPYTPSAGGRAAGSARSSRYVYQPRGTWQDPRRSD